MVQHDRRALERVRVIGALTGAALELLLEMVGAAEVRLDLSEVREADADAVHLLAQLAPDQLDRLTCPSWLAARLEVRRLPQPSAAAVGSVS